MARCACGRHIQSGTMCRQCKLDAEFEDRLDDFGAGEENEETDEEWAVQQQGLDGESHTGQATLDGGIDKEGSR